MPDKIYSLTCSITPKSLSTSKIPYIIKTNSDKYIQTSTGFLPKKDIGVIIFRRMEPSKVILTTYCYLDDFPIILQRMYAMGDEYYALTAQICSQCLTQLRKFKQS
jgi:hypothetical protein